LLTGEASVARKAVKRKRQKRSGTIRRQRKREGRKKDEAGKMGKIKSLARFFF
jgi:hypothetical protein